MELTTRNALENQAKTNHETQQVLRELQKDSKESDRRMQRIMAFGIVAMLIIPVLLNYLARKLD